MDLKAKGNDPSLGDPAPGPTPRSLRCLRSGPGSLAWSWGAGAGQTLRRSDLEDVRLRLDRPLRRQPDPHDGADAAIQPSRGSAGNRFVPGVVAASRRPERAGPGTRGRADPA